MAKIYSRNIAHLQLPVSNFPQSAPGASKKPGPIKIGHPVFPGSACPNDIDASGSKPNGLTVYDWATNLLGGGSDLWKADGGGLRLSFTEEIVVAESLAGPTGGINAKRRKRKIKSCFLSVA